MILGWINIRGINGLRYDKNDLQKLIAIWNELAIENLHVAGGAELRSLSFVSSINAAPAIRYQFSIIQFVSRTTDLQLASLINKITSNKMHR